MRQQNRNGAPKLRQGGAHRAVLGEVIASRREPRLRGLSELDLLSDPSLEPLAYIVAPRAARPALRDSHPIIQPHQPTAPRRHRHDPKHRGALAPNLNQLIRREIPPPGSGCALQPLLDNELPVRSNINPPLPPRYELGKPLPTRQSRPTLTRRAASTHQDHPALFLDLQRCQVAIRPVVEQLPIEPVRQPMWNTRNRPGKMPRGSRNERMRSPPASVAERAQPSLLIAPHQHTLAAQITCQEVANRRSLNRVSDHLPGRPKQPLPLRSQQHAVRICPPRQMTRQVSHSRSASPNDTPDAADPGAPKLPRKHRPQKTHRLLPRSLAINIRLTLK